MRKQEEEEKAKRLDGKSDRNFYLPRYLLNCTK